MKWARHVKLVVLLVVTIVAAGMIVYQHFPQTTSPAPVSVKPAVAIPAVALSGAESAVADAIQAAREVVDASPDSDTAWGRLGMLLHVHGFNNESIPCYAQAAQLNPREFRWPYLLGLVLRKTDTPKAIDQYRAALRIQPDEPAVRVRLGEALLSLQQVEEARTHFDQAAKLDPRCSHALLGLARIELIEGRPEWAVNTLKRAADLGDDHGAVYSTLAQALARTGDERGAAEAAAIASRMTAEGHLRDQTHSALIGCGVSAQWCNHRGNRLLTVGRYQEAAAEYHRAVTADPSSAAFWINYARALGMAGHDVDAVTAYEKGFSLQMPDAFHRTHFGMLLCRLGRSEEGLAAFRQAVAAEPGFPEAYLQMCAVLSANGQAREAVESLRAGVRNAPRDTTLAATLAWVLATHSDESIRNGPEALQHAIRACELCDRKDAHALAAHAAALAEVGRYDEARKAVTEALSLVEGEASPKGMTQDLQSMLTMFTNHQAYRENR